MMAFRISASIRNIPIRLCTIRDRASSVLLQCGNNTDIWPQSSVSLNFGWEGRLLHKVGILSLFPTPLQGFEPASKLPGLKADRSLPLGWGSYHQIETANPGGELRNLV